MANRAPTFGELARSEKPFVLPGAHDGLSARLIEQAGFTGLFVGGFASIGARHAMPDVGLMGLADISAVARDVRAATTLPMMVDADDGYGDAKNVAHTVRTYERLGVQAIFMEDQVSPNGVFDPECCLRTPGPAVGRGRCGVGEHRMHVGAYRGGTVDAREPAEAAPRTRLGRVPRPSASTSAPVNTATTPGAASASVVSTPAMRACGCGERTTQPWSWSGRLMSSV